MLDSGQCVAPFAGAWIEIFAISYAFFTVSSLPSRERGLKWTGDDLRDRVPESLPSRERGLKSRVGCGAPVSRVSLPSRERGLKSVQDVPVGRVKRRSLRGSVD